MTVRLATARRDLLRLRDRLALAHPAARLGRAQADLRAAGARLTQAIRGPLAATRVRLAAGKLDVLSTLASLARGYAIVRRDDGTVVRDAAALAPGDEVGVLLARGRARARIVDTEDGR